jgi:hypothetical protein
MMKSQVKPHHASRPPVIILGPARSGTKLLRGLVAATGQYAEVPFDVNYIWRYGNENCPHDVLPVASATDHTRAFIRARLERCAARNNKRHTNDPQPFVEKTVSNILRVPFVKRVFPEAKYIAIVRDGRDVVESAERCWREPPQTGYLLAKLRSFPWLQCVSYGRKYAVRLLRRRLGLDRHFSSWGPRYPGIDDDVARLTLLEVCARQWAASMEHYERARHLLRPDQLIEIRYEDLIATPQLQVHRLCGFLGISDRRSVVEAAKRTIRADRVGSACRLSSKDSQRVLEIIRPTLLRWGYFNRTAASAA